MEDYYYFPNSRGPAGYVVEAGFPGHTVPRNPISSPSPRTRRASRGNADAGELHHHHYLDACFRCGRHLGGNKDIFMYRGDTPFCSDECRQQQIEADEARERRSRQQQQQQPTARSGSASGRAAARRGFPSGRGDRSRQRRRRKHYDDDVWASEFIIAHESNWFAHVSTSTSQALGRVRMWPPAMACCLIAPRPSYGFSG